MKIIVVCLGNICRSPLGHGILQDRIRKKGLNWEVESAGTGDWHIGKAPDHRSIAIAEKYGVDIAHQRAQQFNKSFFDAYDHVLVMDKQNYEDVIALAADENDKNKVQLFLEAEEVPDPYWDDALFDPVYQMIEKRCDELINMWLNK